MGNLFSAFFDMAILAGVVTFIFGWMLGECKIALTERARVLVFASSFTLFVTLQLLGRLPPLPRIW